MSDIPDDIMKTAEDTLDQILCHDLQTSGSTEALRKDAITDIAMALHVERDKYTDLLSALKDLIAKAEAAS